MPGLADSKGLLTAEARGVAWSLGPPRVANDADGDKVGEGAGGRSLALEVDWLLLRSPDDGHSCYFRWFWAQTETWIDSLLRLSAFRTEAARTKGSKAAVDAQAGLAVDEVVDRYCVPLINTGLPLKSFGRCCSILVMVQ